MQRRRRLRNRRASLLADVVGTVEQACGFSRVADDPEARWLRRGLEREARLHRHLVGWRKTSQQLTELETVEDPARLVVVVSRPARFFQLSLDGHVEHDR